MNYKIFISALCFLICSCAQERRDVVIRDYPRAGENGRTQTHISVSDPVRQTKKEIIIKRIYNADGSYDGEIKEITAGEMRVYDKSGNIKYVIKTLGVNSRIYAPSGSYEGEIAAMSGGSKRVYDKSGNFRYEIKSIAGKQRVYDRKGNFVKEIITIR